MATNKCPNGHDKNKVGTGKGGCLECKREASRRYREARKAGKPLQEAKRQPRTDLGYTDLKTEVPYVRVVPAPPTPR